MKSARRAILALVLCLLAFDAPAAHHEAWEAVADEGVILVVTRNADETLKETKIWIAVIDGQAYVRTGNTSWFANVERDPNVTLRIAGVDHAVRTELVTDEALVERVHAAFREKYGWSDWFVGLMPGAGTKVMRVHER